MTFELDAGLFGAIFRTFRVFGEGTQNEIVVNLKQQNLTLLQLSRTTALHGVFSLPVSYRFFTCKFYVNQYFRP